jgi:hypothetical protein
MDEEQVRREIADARAQLEVSLDFEMIIHHCFVQYERSMNIRRLLIRRYRAIHCHIFVHVSYLN